MTLDRIKRFLRRRAGVMGATFACGALAALLLLLPTPRYVARAAVAPTGPGYATPVPWLQGQISSRTLLADVTYAAFQDPVGDPAEALRAPGHDLVEASRGPQGEVDQLTVWAGGPSRQEALEAAEALRAALLQRDAERRARLLRAEPAVSEPTGPSLAELRVALETLRQRHPRLAEQDLPERAAAAAQAARLAREEAAVAALDSTGRAEEVARLEVEVEREARQGYRAHRAEQQAEALARAQQRRREAQRAAAPTSGGPSRSEVLRRDLQRLLARCTPRHPEVRALQRRLDLELERERQERAAPLPAAPLEAPHEAPREDRAAAADAAGARGFVLAGAEEDPALDVPAGWRQRAASYALLQEARRGAREADLALGLAQRRAEQQEARAARLAEQALALQAPRLEEERLLGAMEQARRAAPPADVDAMPAGPALVSGGPPLIDQVIGGGERFGWALVASALLALAAGLLSERQDRTIYRVEDLLDAAPVLGVVPRLRGR